MNVFGDYARFYDTLYESKDYVGECAFLERIFKSHAVGPVRSILDLGCGTGGHLLPLAQRGYAVVGVDCAEEMLASAERKAEAAGLSLEMHLGDLCDLHLDRRFDVVISMFAVMSYQVDNADLARAFQAARRHLEPGGLFIHDAWFGPAVLTDPPTDRCKVIERDGERIIRFAHPEMDAVRQVVAVHYQVLHLKGSSVVEEVEEVHRMRPLFAQEIAYFAERNGFELVKVCPFMDLDRALTTKDWNACFIARAV